MSVHLNKPQSQHFEGSPPADETNKAELMKLERERSRPDSKWLRVFSRMADLPHWTVGGKQLHGKLLNWSIGFVASMGFLMFGYDQGWFIFTLDKVFVTKNFGCLRCDERSPHVGRLSTSYSLDDAPRQLQHALLDQWGCKSLFTSGNQQL